MTHEEIAEALYEVLQDVAVLLDEGDVDGAKKLVRECIDLVDARYRGRIYTYSTTRSQR